MEVILKEDVTKLGSRGDVVKVAEGYGRNYLLPRKLAIQANAGNKAVIVQMKAASVRRSAKEKTQAEELAKQFDGLSVSFQRRSGEHDHLFGSPPNPAPRASEVLGRVHRPGEAPQGSDRSFESCH
jgi:large subunit ribosomal protein L9